MLGRTQDGRRPERRGVDEAGLNSDREPDCRPEVGGQALAFVSLDSSQGGFQDIDRFDRFLALAKAHDDFVHG
jgi:hypothetical protein